MNARHPLRVVRVGTPCTADWDEMTGDATRRFCQGCQKHVHDLSAMSEGEATQLVCQSAGELCIRYVPNADGQPITLSYRSSKVPRWRWRLWSAIAIILATVTGSVEAFFYSKRVQIVPTAPPPNPPALRPLMGVMVVGQSCPNPIPPAIPQK